MDRYQVQQGGSSNHTEWWIPAEELEELNDHIVGLIEVIGEYRAKEMRLNESHPMNQRLLQSMRNRKDLRNNPEPIVSRDKHPNPYMETGSHPDIVGHVWDTLGSSLPVDCRAIVYGTPALVHPGAGVVFALAYDEVRIAFLTSLSMKH